jgi:hypothetical protein
MVEKMKCVISFNGNGICPFRIGNEFEINGDIYVIESDLKTKLDTEEHHDITLERVWKK